MQSYTKTCGCELSSLPYHSEAEILSEIGKRWGYASIHPANRSLQFTNVLEGLFNLLNGGYPEPLNNTEMLEVDRLRIIIFLDIMFLAAEKIIFKCTCPVAFFDNSFESCH